jgi:hypothetical protein
VEESSGERLVRLPTFNGKFESFMIWWIRFRAFATVCKFIETLKPKDEADMPTTEGEVLVETVLADALKIAAEKRNAAAMANFAMSFTDETAVGVICEGISANCWPAGKASVIVTLLLKKHEPEDTMARVELRQELNKISVTKGQELAAVFEQISAAENPCNAGTAQVNKED